MAVMVERAACDQALADKILTDDALRFVEHLHKKFDGPLKTLMADRGRRHQEIKSGKLPTFLDDTAQVRADSWQVAPAPADLNDRRAEITGPVDRKMVINALNSGAKVFMADFEDSQSPRFDKMIEGQNNLALAIRREIDFKTLEGKEYKLGTDLATLVVRPRGLHLREAHISVDGTQVAGPLVDFGLYFFHNAKELLSRKSGPYFYLPKLESHLEARWWNDVFKEAQTHLGVDQGTIRATVLIETINAAFEMDEILYELRDHAAGLNAGRWDYIFTMIKRFPENFVKFPDRQQVTMAVPFMTAYTNLLVKTCHKRQAHAIGGMSAFIPNRREPEVTEKAIAAVTVDKEREANAGFDGTWVAHPDLIPVARQVFDKALGTNPHQKSKTRDDFTAQANDLYPAEVEGGKITMAGIRNNIKVSMQYIQTWLAGTGAVAIDNLMEDAATAEIARAQLWHWIRRKDTAEDGTVVTKELYEKVRTEELQGLKERMDLDCTVAASILDELVTATECAEFLTLGAYQKLIQLK